MEIPSVSAMQTATSGVPWMTIAQIVVPSLTSIIVAFVAGWFITRRIEDYKTKLTKDIEQFKGDLAKDIHRYQTLHPRRFEIVQKVMGEISAVKADLDLALQISDDSWFYRGDVERQESELSPVAQRISKRLREIKADVESKRFIFDDETSQRIDATLKTLSEASSAFMVHLNDGEEDDHYIPALTTAGLQNVKSVINVEIPRVQADLQTTLRRLFFPS